MVDPTIANAFGQGTYAVAFVHTPSPLTTQGRYDIVDHNMVGVLIRHRTAGQEVVLLFVPWTNIVSIDVSK